jgi:hypothetical protein
MRCYFCQSLLSSHEGTSPCFSCINVNEKIDVRISYLNGKLIYAHIFVFNLHVRLHLQDNFTLLIKPDVYSGFPVTPANGQQIPGVLLQLPGFPITPANAHQKVKLYLTFF